MKASLAQDFERYVEAAGQSLLAAISVYDLAIASNKMMSWDCVGDDNDAWKQGPYISAGQGEQQIDRTRPYCLMVSKEFSVSCRLVIGPDPKVGSNGGVRLPLAKGFSEAEKTIAKLIIIEQFEIFKDFWSRHDGPYNQKNAKKWEGKGFDDTLAHLRALIDRRNELVHNDPCELPRIREAVEYYFGLRVSSEQLAGLQPTAHAAIRSLKK